MPFYILPLSPLPPPLVLVIFEDITKRKPLRMEKTENRK